MKQVLMVLSALELGPSTSRDIADETGMSLPAVSSYLSLLCADGAIQILGTKRYIARGRASNVYELARQKIFQRGTAA